MDEAKLLEKLRFIEALFAGATTDGERIAAGEARKRIQLRLERTARPGWPRPVGSQASQFFGPSHPALSAFLTVFSSTPNAAPIARRLIPSRRITRASGPIPHHDRRILL